MSDDWILKAPRMWVVPSMSGDTGPAPGTVEDCTEFAEAIARRLKKRATNGTPDTATIHREALEKIAASPCAGEQFRINCLEFPDEPQCPSCVATVALGLAGRS